MYMYRTCYYLCSAFINFHKLDENRTTVVYVLVLITVHLSTVYYQRFPVLIPCLVGGSGCSCLYFVLKATPI